MSLTYYKNRVLKL